MAIQSTTQVIYDGVRNAKVQLTGICDGTGGDEAAVIKVDVSSLIPVGGRIKIKELTYDVAYGAVKLSWEAAPPVDFLVLNGFGKFDYRKMDGLPNLADSSATGNILLTTIGFDLNSSYSLLLEMIKKPV